MGRQADRKQGANAVKRRRRHHLPILYLQHNHYPVDRYPPYLRRGTDAPCAHLHPIPNPKAQHPRPEKSNNRGISHIKTFPRLIHKNLKKTG